MQPVHRTASRVVTLFILGLCFAESGACARDNTAARGLPYLRTDLSGSFSICVPYKYAIKRYSSDAGLFTTHSQASAGKTRVLLIIKSPLQPRDLHPAVARTTWETKLCRLHFTGHPSMAKRPGVDLARTSLQLYRVRVNRL